MSLHASHLIKWAIQIAENKYEIIPSPHYIPGDNTTQNDMYEGFAKDLIDAIAGKCGFKYKITTSKEYGKENPITKQWNGIVGEIVDKRSDLAIGDITITRARRTAIEFSTPFMTLGIRASHKARFYCTCLKLITCNLFQVSAFYTPNLARKKQANFHSWIRCHFKYGFSWRPRFCAFQSPSLHCPS